VLRQHLGSFGAMAGCDGPLFVQLAGVGKGGRWGKGAVADRLRRRLRDVAPLLPGLSLDLGALSAHSLRKGGATAAANAGVSEESIMAHGRWRSDAVKRYIIRSAELRLQVVERM
jgi:hypothetical protein